MYKVGDRVRSKQMEPTTFFSVPIGTVGVVVRVIPIPQDSVNADLIEELTIDFKTPNGKDRRQWGYPMCVEPDENGIERALKVLKHRS